MESAPGTRLSSWALKAGLIVLLLSAVLYCLRADQLQRASDLIRTLSFPRSGVAVGIYLSLLLFMASLIFYLSGFFFIFRYRPCPPPPEDRLPEVTIVIPAYNEGATVRIALLSALNSDYPRDRLHVVAVDDGSTDDTWSHIESVAAAHPQAVTALRLAENQGKRAAMREGFLRARGEVVVTVDSDSRIDRGGLRHLVAPLVAEPTVGSVSGAVHIVNPEGNFFSRMFDIDFAFSNGFHRTVQSMSGAVLVCPGVFTAFRRAAVIPVLESWAHQSFLGVTSLPGEDRGLVTWVMSAGFRSVFQSTAKAHTIAPATLRGFVRTHLRWERGNIREALLMARVLLSRWQRGDSWRAWTLVELLYELLVLPWVIVLFGLLGLLAAVSCPEQLPVLWLARALPSLLLSLYCWPQKRSTSILYFVWLETFKSFALWWIKPYALLTLRDRRWLTR